MASLQLVAKKAGDFVAKVSKSNGMRENTRAASTTSKDFFWDDAIVILVSAIVGLNALDVAADSLIRSARVRCFSHSIRSDNVNDDYINTQDDFVDSFCKQSLAPAEYFTVFIFAQGLGLLAPHRLWKALFKGSVGSFFELVNGLDRLRNVTTGKYSERNFEIVSKLHHEHKKGTTMFRVYYAKLLLQLIISLLTLFMGVWYFDDFSPNFTCPDNSSRSLWPLDMANVTCVYTSLRFLSVVRIVDMVFVGFTIPFILYGIGWCFTAHTRELGYARIADFVANSCFLSEHLNPMPLFSSFISCLRISNDLDFLLMRLFRMDTGHGQVFREIQIENELARLIKQNSELLELHYHSQQEMGDHVFEGNLQKPRLEGSTKAFRRRGFVGTPRHNIYRHFSDRFGAMAVVEMKKHLTKVELSRLAEALATDRDAALSLVNAMSEDELLANDQEIKKLVQKIESSERRETLLETLLHTWLHKTVERRVTDDARSQRQQLQLLIRKCYTKSGAQFYPDSVLNGYFSEQADEFLHRLHELHYLADGAGSRNAMDVSFGSTGSALILPWFFRRVISIHFGLHIGHKEVQSVTKKAFDCNFTTLHIPADIFVQDCKVLKKFKDVLQNEFFQPGISRYRFILDFIIVAPMETNEKALTVGLLLNHLHRTSLFNRNATILTVRPLEIDGRVTVHKFIDYEPNPSLFTAIFTCTTKNIMDDDTVQKNYRKLQARIGTTCFKKVGEETGIVTRCGSVNTITKFSLYKYNCPLQRQGVALEGSCRSECQHFFTAGDDTSGLPAQSAADPARGDLPSMPRCEIPTPQQLHLSDSSSMEMTACHKDDIHNLEDIDSRLSECPQTSLIHNGRELAGKNIDLGTTATSSAVAHPDTDEVLTLDEMFWIRLNNGEQFTELPFDYVPSWVGLKDSSEDSESI